MQSCTYCSGRDRQCQRHAHKYGHEYAHCQRVKFGRPHYQSSQRIRGISDRSRNQPGYAHTRQQGHGRCHEQIDLRLLAHRLAHFACEYGDEVHGERSSRSAHCVRCITYRNKGEQHHSRRLERVSYSYCHCRTRHRLRQTAYGQALPRHIHNLFREYANVELAADGVQDGSDQEGAEKALSHG